MYLADTPQVEQGFDFKGAVRQHALLWAGLAVVLIPTLVRLAQDNWTLEIGAHGPIVLATGLWLLWHTREEWQSKGSGPAPAWMLLAGSVLCAVVYAFGRGLGFLALEAVAAYGFVLLAFACFIGIPGILRTAFPFLYLGFLVPLPGWVLDLLTGSLREWVSIAATGALQWLGYPVAREGVVIYIGPYQLLVEDACAGMNSLVGLTAIGMFYIFILHRANWKHALLLLAAIIPIAIVANLIRVIALILVTHYFGDGVAQGLFHDMAGIMLFALSLGMMVGVDRATLAFAAWRQRARQ